MVIYSLKDCQLSQLTLPNNRKLLKVFLTNYPLTLDSNKTEYASRKGYPKGHRTPQLQYHSLKHPRAFCQKRRKGDRTLSRIGKGS